MATREVTGTGWSLRIPEGMMRDLQNHVFPGDGDEHGAVIGAVVSRSERGTKLLARRLFLAVDGTDYVPGRRGYRMLTADFVTRCALACQEETLAYLAVHCHGGTIRVSFSGDDMASHERGYPSLLDILDGPPVGGLVFAQHAAASDVWLNHHERIKLDHVIVVSERAEMLTATPQTLSKTADPSHDRQVRLFGDRGQAILRNQKVAVVGIGGAGSLIVEQLSRLGVGTIVAIDPERVEASNVTRVVGSRRRDARPLLTHQVLPTWTAQLTEKLRTKKTSIAKRLARGMTTPVRVVTMNEDVTSPAVANELVDCDYIFLAADAMQARLVVNSIVHQYLIPGVQVGAKVQTDKKTGDVVDVFTVVRPLIPGKTCLLCNGLINATRLAEEAANPTQRKQQRYIPEVHAPSVITLNSLAVSRAMNDYLFNVTGLAESRDTTWHKYFPMSGLQLDETPRQDTDCRYCVARLGAGPQQRLPVKSKA